MVWVILSFSLLKGSDSLSLSLLNKFKCTKRCFVCPRCWTK